MKRKILFVIGIILMASSQNARAACTAGIPTYTACKPGYYLRAIGSFTACQACPSSGTSANLNSGGITDCYLPSGTTGSDTTGTFTYTADCYYGS